MLYKYFSDVEAILFAWHECQVTGHLEHLAKVRDQAGDAVARLEAVLKAYALISHEHHGTELADLLHRGEHVSHLCDILAVEPLQEHGRVADAAVLFQGFPGWTRTR